MAELFSRWREGLSKTSKAAFGRLAGLLGATEITADTWDDLEALLIQADLGLETTQSVLQALKMSVRREGLTRADELRAVLRAELRSRLISPPELRFAVKPAVILLVGVNGSGKTTTIRLLLGLLAPSAGRAEVLGFDTRTQAAEIRARAGVVLDSPGLYEHLTAVENLEFWARAWHMPSAARRARIKELLDWCALWDRRAERVGTWSTGMKKRLALARALLPEPVILLLDEPTAGLDVTSAAALRNDLARLVHEQGITVFLSTHNMAEAEQLCTEVAVIRKGRLLAVGS
ncbi:MAG: ATP-binding cassette domain-containing protein, partial [Anaerolineales bacterium]